MKPPPVTIAANANCELAENPLWHSDDRSVYWTDIPAGKIYRFDDSTQKYRVIYEGEPVGGFTFQQDGSLLLFRVKDVAHLQLDERVSSFRQFSEDGMDRFNDVIADPEGRVFRRDVRSASKVRLVSCGCGWNDYQAVFRDGLLERHGVLSRFENVFLDLLDYAPHFSV